MVSSSPVVHDFGPSNIKSPSEAKPSLLLYSALSPTPFRSIKLRTRRPTCPACGDEGQKIGEIASTDYVAFCGGTRPDWETLGLHDGDHRIKAKVSDENYMSKRLVHGVFRIWQPCFSLILRPGLSMFVHPSSLASAICLAQSVRNVILVLLICTDATEDVPLAELVANPQAHVDRDTKEVYFTCRLGNDSQLAVDAVRSLDDGSIAKDLIGGLRAWTKDVDPNFPIY